MKNTRVILIIFALVLASFCYVDAQNGCATADELLTRFEAALKAKNSDAILGLMNWEGVSDDMKATQQQIIGTMVMQEVTAVQLGPLPPNSRLEYERNGIRYTQNVTVVGLIDIQFAQKGNYARMPYGKINNAYYLSNVVEERMYKPAKKETSLCISIIGTGSPKPVTFEGFYVYVKGRKEIKEKIIDTMHAGNYSYAFWGDRIKSCVVWKKSVDGKIKLLITDNGKYVFESEWETKNKPIVYEAK